VILGRIACADAHLVDGVGLAAAAAGAVDAVDVAVDRRFFEKCGADSMCIECTGGKTRFCARVDVDTMLEKYGSIGALAELEMKLASLTAKASAVTSLDFAVSDTHARTVLMDGGTAELVAPRVVEEPPRAPPDPVDSAELSLLPPVEPPLPPVTLNAVVKAVLYAMRAITGEEWCRTSGGHVPRVESSTLNVNVGSASTVVSGTFGDCRRSSLFGDIHVDMLVRGCCDMFVRDTRLRENGGEAAVHLHSRRVSDVVAVRHLSVTESTTHRVW
jgi:hypothetical protein